MSGLKSVIGKSVNTIPHMLITARAGTGKTTTLVEGLKKLRGDQTRIKPSKQQKVIWDAICLSKDPGTVAFCAFSKSIADELSNRVPFGCEATTLHRLGRQTVVRAFPRAIVDDRGQKFGRVYNEVTGRVFLQDRKTMRFVLRTANTLIDKARLSLAETREELLKVAEEYQIQDVTEEVLDLTQRMLAEYSDIDKYQIYDFNDMIWLPVKLKLPVFKFGLLLVDEAQDLNRVQQQLVLMAGKRIILCGDPKQAIFGFAGSDNNSMSTMRSLLEKTSVGVAEFSLNVTRRCSQAVVAEANKLVKDFYSHENNPVGSVSSLSTSDYRRKANPTDMVVCRFNAPLVCEAFSFWKAGKRARILGRELGTDLVALIFKLMGYAGDYQEHFSEARLAESSSTTELIAKVESWAQEERLKELSREYPSDTKLNLISDKAGCIIFMAMEETSVSSVVVKINDMFTDRKEENSIVLSSIHKAKGLEANTVYFINRKDCRCPSPMAKTPKDVEQEKNLQYVAITRARLNLVYVN